MNSGGGVGYRPVVTGVAFFPFFSTGGSSAPCRCHGRLSWLFLAIASCSCPSSTFWSSFFAFASGSVWSGLDVAKDLDAGAASIRSGRNGRCANGV